MAKVQGRAVQDGARKGALALLAGLREGRTLADQAGRLNHLSQGDRARAQRLALAVLRHRDRADAVLGRFLQRKPRPEAADVLRLATVEMLELGEAPHGAVNAAVDLMRGMGKKGQAAAGMVNAVLRKVADVTDWADLPVQPLPNWLRKALVAAYGREAVTAMEAAHQAGAPLDLTLKPGAVAPEGEMLPTGSVRLAGSPQLSALPGFDAGDWWVQDVAAALAAKLLNVQPGERVLDLCAAPGGKTLQLAAAGALVTAVDISDQRMARVAENLARCDLTADLVTADALEYRPETPPDAILLDAPCSATGTIRRHPDLPLLRDGDGVAEIAKLQAALIDHAVDMLPLGGRLVFATCSLLPAEGEDQLAAALTRHPGLEVIRPDADWVEPGWLTDAGALRLRPDFWADRGGMDGFFITSLRKTA
ncbi:RNA methyltransferase [Paracoccus sp. M683]|uniref:RsmB/NOP family class I SAM-dependent RNA methyltransferase n=1 Tax=Paracoccus sp. M683 TaxID=2594268 RepID=UPI00117FA3CE|nr:transcription antitermination factor NusB [Paracoccus sp. M683]TRW99676.1 RNA methyltransferase [Paracoccus sp. M683]